MGFRLVERVPATAKPGGPERPPEPLGDVMTIHMDGSSSPVDEASQAPEQDQSKAEQTEPKAGGQGEKPESQKSSSKKGTRILPDTKSARFDCLVDLVATDAGPAFLIKESSGELTIEYRYPDSINGKNLIPPTIDHLPFELVSAKELAADQGFELSELYQAIVAKLKETSKLPSEAHYHLCAVYIFLTYLSESAQYLPFLWFHGLPERGKSRITKVICRLSYRGFYTETLNPAPLFRFADAWGGTICIDVYEITKLAKNRGSYDFLLVRWERGAKTPRVINLEKGAFEDVKYFSVSGPTIIATNVSIPNQDPLRSRCIQILMPEASSRYRNIQDAELNPLKVRLLKFRAAYMGQPLPDVEKPANGRLGDLMQPLFAVAQYLPSDAQENLESLIESIKSERRAAEGDSLYGQIMQALYVWQIAGRAGKLKVSRVTKTLNSERSENTKLSAQKVGSAMATMGINRRKSNGTMHVVWDDDTMQALFERYDINEETVPLLSPDSLKFEKLMGQGGCKREGQREPE